MIFLGMDIRKIILEKQLDKYINLNQEKKLLLTIKIYLTQKGGAGNLQNQLRNMIYGNKIINNDSLSIFKLQKIYT